MNGPVSTRPADDPQPDLDTVLAGLRVVAIPMRVRFRGVAVREAALVEGPAGWGEFSPFLEYGPAESAAWLRAALDYGWSEQPAPLRDRIPVNATVPAVDVGEVAAILASYHGCRTAKVKVAERGQTLADDVARVAEVRRVLGPEGRIRVDANGGWNVDEAEHAVHALASADLEYVEQPCASVDELALATGLGSATVLGALTALEIRGLVIEAYGRYRASGPLAASGAKARVRVTTRRAA